MIQPDALSRLFPIAEGQAGYFTTAQAEAAATSGDSRSQPDMANRELSVPIYLETVVLARAIGRIDLVAS